MDTVAPGVRYTDYLHFRQRLTMVLIAIDWALLIYVLHLLSQ